jgi:hypothetical protein
MHTRHPSTPATMTAFENTLMPVVSLKPEIAIHHFADLP